MKPRYLLAIISGILIGTSYIPFPPWAIFFCFVPLWLAWRDVDTLTYKQLFWTGWTTQFILTLIGFNWVSYTVHEFGHMPWALAILVLAAFCAIANLHIPLAGLVWLYGARRLKLGETARFAWLAVLFAVGYRAFPMIFDWHFGYTWLWAGFPAFQLADVVGFIGLNDLGLIFNALVLYALTRRRPIWIGVAVAAFAALNVAGYFWGRRPLPTDATARFLVVQANIGNQEKLMAETGWRFRDVVIGRFTSLTAKGLAANPGADFIVWPETAFPETIDDAELSQPYPARLRRATQEGGVKMILGGYSHLPTNGKITNSFFILGPDGRWLSPPYHKTVLLAFGEYMPFGDLIPRLREMIPETADFGRGPGPTVLDGGGGVKIGAQICYEGLFDWFTRDLANRGAQVIVNVTNDSWYGKWAEPYQHGYMTLARAVEVRRPLVRSTNTGLTAAILAGGEILTPSPLHEEWFHLYEIPYATRGTVTPFMSWGYWLMPLLLAAGLVGFGLSGFGAGEREKNEQSGLG